MSKASSTLAVLLPLPLADAYDYLPGPESFSQQAGCIVEAPIGKKQSIGVIWGPGSGDVAPANLKSILNELDLPPLPAASRAFVDWVADYTVSPRGAVLKMVFGSARLLRLKKNDVIDCPAPDPDHHVPVLTEEQREAAAVLVAKIGNRVQGNRDKGNDPLTPIPSYPGTTFSV